MAFSLSIPNVLRSLDIMTTGRRKDSPDEDPLHGRCVTEDGNDDGVVHHDAKADGSAMQIMGKRVQDDVDIVFMVPKHGGKDQKRVVISSATPWEDIYQQLATIMGYEEDDEFSISYRFSNSPKLTQNSLEDESDYAGIVEVIRARCRNATPLQVIILDNNVETSAPVASSSLKPPVKQRELPEDNQTVTYNSPPNNACLMFHQLLAMACEQELYVLTISRNVQPRNFLDSVISPLELQSTSFQKSSALVEQSGQMRRSVSVVERINYT
ncbi:hypothetical protein BJV74DRAFT_991050 [Russula compacta]|nr:hypothetical protein BJV74DRAFT_991050 [Russula compacta]